MYLLPRVVCILRLPTPPPSRLGSSFSCCASAATDPNVYAEHYAARAAALKHRHLAHRQSSRTAAYCVIWRCPLWSPATPPGRSIRG
jgi:hypothetical protein